MPKLSMNLRSKERKSPFLALRSDFEFLPIGTRVHYTHRAGVARYKKLWKDPPKEETKYYSDAKPGALDLSAVDLLPEEKAPIGWKIVEGANRNDSLVPDDPLFGGTGIGDYYENHIRYAFAKLPQAKSRFGFKLNKTVMVWPCDSFGWVIGMVRRAIGVSHKGGYSGGYYEREYEPGYLDVEMYVDLYVIKTYYEGVEYIYCPVWAVSRVEE